MNLDEAIAVYLVLRIRPGTEVLEPHEQEAYQEAWAVIDHNAKQIIKTYLATDQRK